MTKRESLQWQDRVSILAFHNLDRLIHCEAPKELLLAAGWPRDFQALYLGGAAQANALSQWVGTKASPTVGVFVDRAWFSVFDNIDTNARSNCRPVRLGANQIDTDPVIAETGILAKDVAGLVAEECATPLLKNVLVTIIVEVGKDDRVAFLKVTKAAGR